MPTFDGNSIDIFSSRDRIREQIIDFANDYLELTDFDFNKTSYLSYLINIISTLTANLMYYNSSVSREFFLTKATQKESVLNLAAMLGYLPPLAKPATVDVLIKMPTDFTSNVNFTIPKGFKYFAGDIVFTQNNAINVEINRVSGSTDIFPPIVREIQTVGGSKVLRTTLTEEKDFLWFVARATQKELLFVENQIPILQPYEFFKIDSKFDGQMSKINLLTTQTKPVDIDEYINLIESGRTPPGEVYDTWTQYDSLYLIPFDARGFTFRRTESGGQIFFGNGIIGKQPDSNSISRMVIEVTKGALGNVIAGTINKSENLFVEDYDNVKKKNFAKPVRLEITNTITAINGKDSPTIDQIRVAALANVTANKRLVSELDFKNIKEIVPDLPIKHSIHIMKRSDLKRNEINVFTTLFFADAIVPTRNAIWKLIASDSTGSDNIQVIHTNDTITLNEEEYYSMFHIEIDIEDKTSSYFYIITSLDKPAVLTFATPGNTEILPSNVVFTTNLTGNNDTNSVEIDFRFDKIVATSKTYTNTMITEWDGKEHTLNFKEDTEGLNPRFESTAGSILLKDVPTGEQLFRFKMFESVLGGDGTSVTSVEINESQTSALIRENLDNFMYSQVQIVTDSVNHNITLYDVPVIKKSYFDNIDQNQFTLEVFEKVVLFDVEQYRMATDFVNIKFADTIGLLDNMRFNKTSKTSVSGINPTLIPSNPVNNERYIVTDLDFYSSTIWDRTEPFIANFKTSSGEWIFEKLTVNDIISVSGNIDPLIFNGERMVDPKSTIPFPINLVVWRDRTHPASEQAVIDNIKNTLVEELFTKFGFDQNIFLSEIESTVQDVPGVRNVKVTEPDFDIFFNYDITRDLTQTQLLEYTPQFISFNTSTISIEMR